MGKVARVCSGQKILPAVFAFEAGAGYSQALT